MSSVIHAGNYEVFVGNDTFLQLGKLLGRNYQYSKKVILTDENTFTHCLPLLQERVLALKDVEVIRIEPGEKNKSLPTCEKIWDKLTSLNADRRTVLINFGGGMVCDVGGFAASVFLRGIDFINIPTTLLSMVDSSVGGKTGINFSGLKNQVGTFKKPAAVFISPVWLRTLDDREVKSGFAEMIKHALISSRDKWNELKHISRFEELNWIHHIRESVFLKNRIVNADFRDRKIRKTLNFGHTIGHALESYSIAHHDEPLKHGEAVALGMVGEIFLSQKMSGFPDDAAAEIVTYLLHHFPLQNVHFDADEVVKLMRSDKKNEMSQIHFVLLKDIGEPLLSQVPDEQLIMQSLQSISESASKPELQS